MYYIYILKLNNRKYYTGITNNINRRLKEHLTGKSKSTKYHRPICLALLIDTWSRKMARKIEVKIKNMGAKKFITMNKFENKYSDIVKYPDMLRFILKIPYKVTVYNNERYITFPEPAF